MDTVILAAGRGTRVRDIAPAFHKPLLPIDGTPLICRAVELALALSGGVRPVVVVAPANAEAICGALGKLQAFIVIQREPLGPGDALLHGLESCHNDDIMVLLADNVTTLDDVVAVKTAYYGDDGRGDDGRGAVGVKEVPRTEAERFTRLNEEDTWVEKKPILNVYGPPYWCWIGPFMGVRNLMVDKLHRERVKNPDTELLIGPHLDDFYEERRLVPVSSYDVGTLESYPRGGITR